MNLAKKMTRSLVALPVLFLALLCVSCAENNQQPAVIKVGAGMIPGVYDNLAREIERVVNKYQDDTGIRLESVSSGGSVDNINALIAGEVQLGIAQADDQFNAVNGLGKWADSGPQDELRSIVGVYNELVSVVAGGDSGIQSFADLRGKRVDIGLAGSGTQQNAIDALEAAGLNWQTDIVVSESNLDDQLAAFVDGRIDVFFFTAGHPNREIEFATFSPRGARFIALENAESLIVEQPYYSIQSFPVDLYPRALNETPINTLAVRATLVTSVNVPDAVVYDITKIAFENAAKFTQFFPEFAYMRDGKIMEGLTAPVHPGALKYFQEAGISVPE